ncbi:MAG: hypothetical protein LH469_02895 [Frankiaceae bacterium]|nr:hypothetical protein [Frankiaceae bacterium]
MTSTEIVLLVVAIVVVLLIVAAVLAAARKKKRTQELRGTFGDEYDRTVETSDKRRDAERELGQRKQEHEKLDIRPLSSASRQRYLTAWDGVQSRFVDNPVLALSEADALLTQLLDERGFPTGDSRESERMLSVEHGRVLEGFRAGHAIEQANTSNQADTEQVRQGMLHFRQVFEELVSEDSGEPHPRDDRDLSDDTRHDGSRDDATSVRDQDRLR